MPQTLISFIGTGALNKEGNSEREYRKATYSFGNETIGSSSFVSSVLFDFLSIDKVILIGTVKSMWEEVYRYFCEKNNIHLDEDYWMYLGAQAEIAGHSTNPDSIDLNKLVEILGEGSMVKIIPYGLNDFEQWEIFNVLTEVFKYLDKKDKIHLDVTHAFRSLPLFSITAIMYLKDVIGKTISIEGVYYGMLESSKEFNGVTPIIDLSLIIRLQDWIKGAYSFKEFGKAYLLADLIQKEKDSNILRQFSDALSLNYLSEIERQLQSFKSLAQEIKSPIAKLIVPPLLLDFTNRLSKAKSQAKFQLELSIWHRQRKNYAAAYIVFVESLITHVCEEEQWNWQILFDRNQAKNRLRSYAKYKHLRQMFKSTNSIRNNIAHNLRGTPQEKNANIDDLMKFQNQFLNLIINP